MRAIPLVTLMTSFISTHAAFAGAISSSGLPELQPMIFQCEAAQPVKSLKIEVEVGFTVEGEHHIVVVLNKGLVFDALVSEFQDVKTLSGIGATRMSGENFTFEILKQNGSLRRLKNANASLSLKIDGENVMEMLKCTSTFSYLKLLDKTRQTEAAL